MSESCYMSCYKTHIILAEVIKKRLNSRQYDVISQGSTECNYQSRRTRILDCKVFIAIVTPEFIKQDIHLYELSLALDLGRKILVIQHDWVQELPSPFPALRFVRWYQDLSILANTVFQIIQDQNREFLVANYSFDNDALKRFIWKFEETQIGRQLYPHVKSGEYASSELQLIDIKTTLVTLCEGINKIQDSPALRRKVSRRQFPRDIMRVARRYQDVIAYPIIRQFGRYLDLEEDELNEVERFSEYGTKEAFWQTIRFWLEKKDSSELTVGTIIKALKECDVNLKGKQMSNAHRKVLRSKLTFLVDNIQTEPLIPSLISNNVLCDVTKAYVTAPKTRDQRINRLVDVLMTKEDGLFVFCEILRNSGYQYVAGEIEGDVDKIQYVQNSIATWRPQSRSVSSDCEALLKQLVNRLSVNSNGSSLSSRHNSISSNKIALVAPSVINNNTNGVESRVQSERKTLCSKCDRQIYNDLTVAHPKSEDEGKRKGSSTRNNFCVIL